MIRLFKCISIRLIFNFINYVLMETKWCFGMWPSRYHPPCNSGAPKQDSIVWNLVLLKIRPQKTAEGFIFWSSMKTTETISREMNTFKTYFYLNNWKTIHSPLPQQYHEIPSIAFIFLCFFFPQSEFAFKSNFYITVITL